jgi:hypothetical protein
LMTGNYPSTDFEIIDEGSIRKVSADRHAD